MSTVKNSLTSSPLKNIESLVAASKNRFTEVMPKHMDIERFTRICLGEIKKNPKLLECDQMSLMGAMMTMSQLGV
ncbi:MAG: recombinase RecT, partial [Paraclostridium sp.]